MKIWTDRKGRARGRGRGDIDRQLRELNAIITYAQIHAEKMREAAARALNTDPRLVEENAVLRRQVQARDRTIETADRQLKRREGQPACSSL